MAEINFFEPEQKEPEKSGFGKLLIIIVIILAGVSLVLLSMSKLTEYSGLEKQKNEMVSFIESSDTKKQVNEYYAVQADITRITNENMPVTQAYVSYRLLNTATGSLIDSYIWAPIKANPEALEFKSLSLAGNNLTIIAGIRDIAAMREYQWALAGMKVKVDKDKIDKLLGAKSEEGDTEINKFRDQFTSQIARISDSGGVLQYEGILGVFINKDIPDDMTKLLGKGY